MLTSFEVQKGKKRKANIKEEESSEKVSNIDIYTFSII